MSEYGFKNGNCTAKKVTTDTLEVAGVNVPAPKYGGMYAYDKAIAFNIVTADVYHAFGLRSGGDISAPHLSGFTFDAGRIVDANIVSEANHGGLLQIVTSAAHGLVDGDIVTCHGMNNVGHDKATRITKIDNTTFDCQDITYIAGAGASAGSVYAPAYLQASAGSAGTYQATVLLDGTAANINKDWKWELNIGIAPADNVVTERNSTNTLASMATGGIITIAEGDRIWLSGKNKSDTTDYTVKNMNIYLNRIA